MRLFCSTFVVFFLTWAFQLLVQAEATRPNVVLVMADDLGYAQTGYYGHSLLRTPHLDRLASGGLRLDRFYAAGPVCSPTRASVLTGRTHVRTGVMEHGYALRLQEKSFVSALANEGYATGHFGKWHLNGMRGPGVPIFADDPFSPGAFGFAKWLSVTNFFDRDPLLGREGAIEEFSGDSSEVVVDEMLKFAKRNVDASKPFFSIVWYGTPHSPFKASQEDIDSLVGGDPARQKLVRKMDDASLNQYGELVAMDRSLGALQDGLREMGVLDNTLIWFNSDNGGLGNIKPSSTGMLRASKGHLYEGGIRVPCVIHWPNGVEAGRISDFPACTTDIAPTLVELLDLPNQSLLDPVDGISLKSVFQNDRTERTQPLGFRYRDGAAVIDNDWKWVKDSRGGKRFELYNLADDPSELNDLSKQRPAIAKRLSSWLKDWLESVDSSVAGMDYPEQRVNPNHPEPKFWIDLPQYQAMFDTWEERWEYQSWIKRGRQKQTTTAKEVQ